MRGLQKYLGLFPVLPFVVRKRVRVEVSREASKGERLFGWASAAQTTVRGKKKYAENQRSEGYKERNNCFVIRYWQSLIGRRNEKCKGRCQGRVALAAAMPALRGDEGRGSACPGVTRGCLELCLRSRRETTKQKQRGRQIE